MDNEKDTVKYIENGDDVSLFKLSDDKSKVEYIARAGLRYKTLYIPEGVRTVEYLAFRGVNVKNVVLPDGVEVIERGAFKDCKHLKRIYIPASVKVIEDEVFLDCAKLEIYCGGEPQEGWLDGEKEEKEFWDDMTDAFNFHRSGGSFDDHYIVRRVEVTYNNYNPNKRPVHTNVSREQFFKLIAKD